MESTRRRNEPPSKRSSAHSGATTEPQAFAPHRDFTTKSRFKSQTEPDFKRFEFARLLALVNVAMAEAGMTAWESKYSHDFWRPITGIRESDPGTGPTGLGDGNPDTVGDITFHPLGAPASNLLPGSPNFTPPFPAYPSGHATFGGAIFQILRRFYGTDNVSFTFVSDEFNGITRDNGGNIRPYMPRSFSNLSQAEEENGQSRIYLGIHWSFDKTEGHRAGPECRELRVRSRLHAIASLIALVRRTIVVA